MGNFDVIYDTPSQIYHHALLFCPPSSWLQKCYSRELSQVVKVIQGVPAEWGTCLRTVEPGPLVGALSCRNNTIAVGFFTNITGSLIYDIAFLDAVTGNQTAVLHGHTGGVRCLTFSLDRKLLVSGGDDMTIRLWDVQTGGVIRAFDGYNYTISSVAISADYVKIASVLGHAIYLLDIQSGAMNHISSMQSQIDQVGFSLINPGHLLSGPLYPFSS